MSFGFLPSGLPFTNPVAPGYHSDTEFHLNAVDPGIGAANRDSILTEQQRILGILNDFMIAQKLKLLGNIDVRIPAVANEESNREQLQQLIRDMAEFNVNRTNMTGLINNFGAQYCKFASDRDAVEAQRQLNEIDRQRMSGIDCYPPNLQNYVYVCRFTLFAYAVGALGWFFALWSMMNALKISFEASKAAGLQCLVTCLLAFLSASVRGVAQYGARRQYPPYGPQAQLATGDKRITSKKWDLLMWISTIGFVIGSGILWHTSNQNFVDIRSVQPGTPAIQPPDNPIQVVSTTYVMATPAAVEDEELARPITKTKGGA
ncbi:hypothetical protein ABW19_dt0203110 [Dactylella cylindrospora]|nr:hypothetical protein ABW19_dt0203110 [Dactylella cylindrospora]